MPRIDPLQLLRCLSVLLSPSGGIKSTGEVQRLASLMTKFSKKLVSKCIYIQILKQTQTDLLKMFMTLGGWNLIHTWLSDAVIAKNWPLIEQLLELLLMCPVDVELLKTNSCPKLVKGLSKESVNDCVKQLACKLVEQWLRMVKGETASGSVPTAAVHPPSLATVAVIPSSVKVAEPILEPTTTEPASSAVAPETVPIEAVAETVEVDEVPVKEEPQEADAQDVGISGVSDKVVEGASETLSSEGVPQSPVECKEEVRDSKNSEQNIESLVETPKQEVEDDNLDVDVKKEETATSEDSGEDATVSEGSSGQLPVYKITIRDGKQVLAKVHSGEKPQKSAVVTTVNADVDEEVQSKPEVKQNAIVNLKKIDLPTDTAESTPKKKGEAKVTRAQKNIGKIDRSESVSSDDSAKPSKTTPKKSKEQKKLEKVAEKKTKTKATNDVAKSVNTTLKGKLKNKKEKIEEKLKIKDKDKDKDKEKKKEKEKNELKFTSGSDLDEKDKALLAKLIPPAISKLGKIPKKKRPEDIDKIDVKKTEEIKKGPEKKLPPPPPPPPAEPKKVASMSIEVRKPSSAPRPKTVKTYNSKFRSTGLEEELKPPVPRAVAAVKKPVPAPLLEKKVPVKPPLPVKRPSPIRDVPAEKKLKVDITPDKDKVGGAKLIPPRAKPAFLQESDMFMDALTASSKKEPRKRKRRASSSGKDGPDSKKDQGSKEDDGKDGTPPGSPSGEDGAKSPSSIKPAFKFYQDTLEVDDDKDAEMKDSREQDVSDSGESEENNKSQDADETLEDASNTAMRDDTVTSTTEVEGNTPAKAFKGVLVYHKLAKGPKKSVRWKQEKDLIEVQYFELDETERVNVTKNFTDMKQMERTHEREAFLMARKLSQDDTMEEKIPWHPPVPIDLPPSVVEAGMNSREKDVQYAREKMVLRALYFNKSSIPDSPAEPDLEIHATTDPVVIPLEDASGVQESVNDFTGTPWPEPKPLLPPPSPPHVMQYHQPQQMMAASQGMGPHHPVPLLQQPVMSPPHQPQPQPPPQQFQGYMQQQFPVQQGMMYPGQAMPMMPGPAPAMMGAMTGPMPGPMPLMQQHPTMPQPAGDWRTGDGKVVTMNEMPMEMYNQGAPGMGGPNMPMNMGMGGMPGPDMNYNMMAGGGGEMGGYPQQGFPMGGGPPMFQPQPPPPPPQQQQQQFQMRGNPGRRGMRGGRRGNWSGQNWQGNRGRGGNWGGGGGGGSSGGGGGGNNQRSTVCKHFRSGYCRTGDECPFLHPGVNGPQY